MIGSDRLNTLALDALFAQLVDGRRLGALIDAAVAEDLGEGGDVTSRVTLDEATSAEARMRARTGGRLAGLIVAPLIAGRYDERLRVVPRSADGDEAAPGSVVAELSGPLRPLLAAERVMLNMVCHLSGIATLTARYVEAVAGTAARIYDTRKTLPGYRALAKYAVRCGGGWCHRIGLYDAVLVKDNHLAGAGLAGLPEAIARARAESPPPDFVEVEVDTLEQLDGVLACDVDLVLLDNMPLDQLRVAVARRDRDRPGVQLEASGGVTLDTVRGIAETGVDRIAVGALTHSAPALDIGLDID